MKSFLGLLLILTCILACEKETAEDTISNAINSSENTRFSELRVYYDNGVIPGIEGVDYGCEGSGGNCLEDSYVNNDSTGAQEIRWVCYSWPGSLGNSGSAPPPNSTVQNYFSENAEEIALDLGEDLVDGIITGSLTLSHRGTRESGDRWYLLFWNEAGELARVKPFVF